MPKTKKTLNKLMSANHPQWEPHSNTIQCNNTLLILKKEIQFSKTCNNHSHTRKRLLCNVTINQHNKMVSRDKAYITCQGARARTHTHTHTHTHTLRQAEREAESKMQTLALVDKTLQSSDMTITHWGTALTLDTTFSMDSGLLMLKQMMMRSASE